MTNPSSTDHPAQSGSARPNRSLALLALALLAVAGGCSKTEPAAGPPGGGRQGDAAVRRGPGGRSGGPPPMAVGVQTVGRGDIATYYQSTASLDPDKQADVLARVDGVVQSIEVEEGDRLAEGQVMLVIEDDEYRHRVRQAEVALRQQQVRHERTTTMLEQGLVSAEENDISKSDLEASEAAWELTKLDLSYTRVRAPFAGTVVARHVDLGRTVANGTALFTMADTHRLLARVHVPAREFRRIRADQPVRLVVDSSGDRLSGRIDLISPVIDPTAGTIKVTVEITDFPPTTRPGDFAEVSIVTDRHTDTTLVPRQAVLTDHDERIVYVADAGIARRRVVEVGFEDDVHAEILAGLDEGENLVVQGQRSLSDEHPVAVVERDGAAVEKTSSDGPPAAGRRG